MDSDIGRYVPNLVGNVSSEGKVMSSIIMPVAAVVKYHGGNRVVVCPRDRTIQQS